MSTKKETLKRAVAAAFPHTIPIFAGFWFLGMTYGISIIFTGFSVLRLAASSALSFILIPKVWISL